MRKKCKRALRLQELFFASVSGMAAKQDMTDGTIADRVGISPSYYCGLKNLKKPVSIDLMVAIANVFDKDVVITIRRKEGK